MINILIITTTIFFVASIISLIINAKKLTNLLPIFIILFTTELAYAFVESIILCKYNMVSTINLIVLTVINCLSLFLKSFLVYKGLKNNKDSLKCLSNTLSISLIGLIGIAYTLAIVLR